MQRRYVTVQRGDKWVVACQSADGQAVYLVKNSRYRCSMRWSESLISATGFTLQNAYKIVVKLNARR